MDRYKIKLLVHGFLFDKKKMYSKKCIFKLFTKI